MKVEDHFREMEPNLMTNHQGGGYRGSQEVMNLVTKTRNDVDVLGELVARAVEPLQEEKEKLSMLAN